MPADWRGSSSRWSLTRRRPWTCSAPPRRNWSHPGLRRRGSRCGFQAAWTVSKKGSCTCGPAGRSAADAAVALPALEVPPLPGLPQRQNGFVQTDTAMHVDGLEAVWAAGDATWFPIKQGGLAAQQADVAARSIAARAGAHVPIEAFQPVLRGMLVTGGAPDFLRSSRADPDADVAAAGRGLWSPSTKVAATYLGPYVARALGEADPQEFADIDPSADPAADEAAHQRAVSLVLAAADADARHRRLRGGDQVAFPRRAAQPGDPARVRGAAPRVATTTPARSGTGCRRRADRSQLRQRGGGDQRSGKARRLAAGDRAPHRRRDA